MSGEGELHKKIREITWDTQNGEVQYGEQATKENLKYGSIEHGELMKVLAEAKASFPRLPERYREIFKRTSEEVSSEDKEESIKAVADLCAERGEWFERWFGKAGAEAGKAQTKKPNVS